MIIASPDAPARHADTCRRAWRERKQDSLRGVDDALSRWRSWRLSDRATGLGYPPCSAEQRAGMVSGGSPALPGWDAEMRMESAIQEFRGTDPEGFTTAMLILEIPELLPTHRRRRNCMRRNCRAWSVDQKAAAIGIPRRRMYDRYDAFRWWLRGRLGL